MYTGTASSGMSHWSIPNLLYYGLTKTEALLIQTLPRELMIELHMDNSILHYVNCSFELEGWKTKLTYVTEFVQKIIKEERKEKNRRALAGAN
jgi:hypothetical protein